MEQITSNADFVQLKVHDQLWRLLRTLLAPCATDALPDEFLVRAQSGRNKYYDDNGSDLFELLYSMVYDAVDMVDSRIYTSEELRA